MSENYFDLITQEVYKLKTRREHLEDENRTLHQQLADLRSGHGIVVEIEGKRFSLISPTTSLSAPAHQESLTSGSTLTDSASPISTSHDIVSAPTQVMTPLREEPQEALVEQTLDAEEVIAEVAEDEEPSGAVITKVLEIPSMAHASLELEEEDIASSFLEEALIDEFTSAATSPLAVWSGPPTPSTPIRAKVRTQEEIDEEEKASLRQQLIGSFLLE